MRIGHVTNKPWGFLYIRGDVRRLNTVFSYNGVENVHK